MTGEGGRAVNNKNNIERFSGFANDYDKHRPAMPEIAKDIIKMYLGHTPQTVVDIGSGTGLSTIAWYDTADEVIGVDPNEDMRKIAENKAKNYKNVRFLKGYSDNTGLPDDYADAVTISQAFHWMDYDSTLAEVARILKADCILAVYDCDWPPVIGTEIEEEYNRLHKKCDEISFIANGEVSRKDKNNHLEAIAQSGYFKYTREVVFHNTEPADADRIVGILLSQGAIRPAVKFDSSLQCELDAFAAFVTEKMNGETKDIIFSYRMRLGIK